MLQEIFSLSDTAIVAAAMRAYFLLQTLVKLSKWVIGASVKPNATLFTYKSWSNSSFEFYDQAINKLNMEQIYEVVWSNAY